MQKKKKIFFLSGLSECGKSQAGEWATKNGIFRLKIIYFEKMIAQLEGISITNKIEMEDAIKYMYSNESEMCLKFRNYIYDFMLANKCESISLESLYRANLATSFLHDSRFNTKIIYIDADINKRAQREFEKIKTINSNITIENVLEQTKNKDAFKISKGVLEVKKIATNIIDNNGSLEHFKKNILKIFNDEDLQND
ncbi:hypothetical protein [Williamsoniiplasma lucivorax]|uniref:Dephospho-CoA kinase n=1 Tax=Williamsoniiplasma lucivorax TaxID=209274 RepID=A0A2S5RD73_9MOLU|nr:hypothetical protein [Williamsoniiplasma lucivorax]PPE05247.1 hypothetical protein ELUCI_v1c07830 [Williamsoniiplasma lucivorax]